MLSRASLHSGALPGCPPLFTGLFSICPICSLGWPLVAWVAAPQPPPDPGPPPDSQGPVCSAVLFHPWSPAVAAGHPPQGCCWSCCPSSAIWLVDSQTHRQAGRSHHILGNMHTQRNIHVHSHLHSHSAQGNHTHEHTCIQCTHNTHMQSHTCALATSAVVTCTHSGRPPLLWTWSSHCLLCLVSLWSAPGPAHTCSLCATPGPSESHGLAVVICPHVLPGARTIQYTNPPSKPQQA